MVGRATSSVTGGAVGHPPTLAARQQHWRANLFADAHDRRCPHIVRAVALVAFQQQRALGQQQFALAEAQQQPQIGGRGGQHLGGERQQTEAKAVAGDGGNRSLAREVVATQLHQRQASTLRALPCADDPLRQQVVRGYQIRRRIDGQHNANEALVGRCESREVMQDRFVDMQRRGGDGVALAQFDQSPAAQRPLRQERAPMGVVKRGERQRKRRPGPRGITLGA